MSRLTAEQVAVEMRKESDSAKSLGNATGDSYDDGACDAFACAETIVRENLIETEEQQRERFEAWTLAKLGELPAVDEEGNYVHPIDCVAWTAWRAALNWRSETASSEVNHGG